MTFPTAIFIFSLAMHSLVYHIAMSENRDVVGWAARIIANMSQCSLARNILKQNDGIRKLVGIIKTIRNFTQDFLHCFANSKRLLKVSRRLGRKKHQTKQDKEKRMEY